MHNECLIQLFNEVGPPNVENLFEAKRFIANYWNNSIHSENFKIDDDMISSIGVA